MAYFRVKSIKTKRPNLLIVGSVAFDSIKTPFGQVKKTLGGSASYFSLAASYFTAPALVAVVGNDFSASDEKKLKNKNIDLAGLQKVRGKTFAWGGEYSFDLNTRKTLFTHLNVFENFKPKLSKQQKGASYVFLGNIHPALQKNVLSQITAAKFAGLDTMNYWIESAAKELTQILGLINVLIINDSEAREFSKEHNLFKAAKKILALMKKNAGLVIKRGEYGLLMFQKGQIFHLPGYPLAEVMDPTGAGDSFAGGFMGYVAKTNDTSFVNLKRACLYGAAMASFCVEKMGTSGLLKISFADLNRRIKTFKKLTHFEI